MKFLKKISIYFDVWIIIYLITFFINIKVRKNNYTDLAFICLFLILFVEMNILI